MEFVISNTHQGQRLDVVLTGTCENLGSRSDVQRSIRAGLVSIDGNTAIRTSTKVSSGQIIRVESKSDTARLNCGISTRTTVELAGLLFDGFSLVEAAEVSIYPQYDDAGGVDSERTFVKQIVQKFCDDGSSDDLFNEEEVLEATEA